MGWRSGQSYSQDLRDRVLGAVDGGMTAREAAVIYKVSIAYIYKALIRRRLTGDVGINPGRGRSPRKLSSEQETALDIHIRSHPGMTLAPGAGLVASRAWYHAEHRRSVECSPASGAVFQKKALRAAEQDRPDVAARRQL